MACPFCYESSPPSILAGLYIDVELLPIPESTHAISGADHCAFVAACLPEAIVILILAVADAIEASGSSDGYCNYKHISTSRPHSVTITEFGAVGDGLTLNTVAFQNAVFYLRSFADKGGAQLYVPQGRWLTGSFNLTSHLTLFLEQDAIIIGSQV